MAALQAHLFIQVDGDLKKQKNTKPNLPESTDDGPAVVASVDLELVGVDKSKDCAVPEPEHIRWILVLGAGASEITLHGDGFAQR